MTKFARNRRLYDHLFDVDGNKIDSLIVATAPWTGIFYRLTLLLQ